MGYLVVKPKCSSAIVCRFDGNNVTSGSSLLIEEVFVLFNFPTSRFASHSFRIGAATSAAMDGFDSEELGKGSVGLPTRISDMCV